MTFLSIFVIPLVFLLVKNASAGSFYCEFGTCESEQYCCGDNKCCDKLLDLWYFWVGIVIVVIVVAAIIIIKYYQNKRKSQSHYRYNLLKMET